MEGGGWKRKDGKGEEGRREGRGWKGEEGSGGMEGGWGERIEGEDESSLSKFLIKTT